MRERAAGAEGRLALLQACLGGAGFVAETLAEVLVIGTLGAAWLPIGLAGAALFSLGLTAGLARRQAGPRRLIGLAGAVVVTGVAIWVGLLVVPTLAALAFLLLGRPLRDALAVTFGNLVAPRYDPQSAKRALPRLAAAGQAGAILAGLLLPVLLHTGGIRAAVAIWPLLAGAALAMAWRFPLILVAAGPAKAPPRSAAIFPRHSPLLWALGGAAMLAVVAAGALGLVAAMQLSAAIPDQATLASVYALSGAAGSVGVLLVQLFGLPWLFARIGTARAALIPPTLALGVAAWAVLGAGSGAGVAAQLGRLTLRPAFQTPIEEILLGLLPTGERAAGRAWLRAGAVPLAGLLSGVGLAALAAAGAGVAIVAGVALLAAGGGLILALVLRRQHRRATLALAQSEDALMQRLALPTLGGVDVAVKKEIVQRLAASERDSERELLVALLADLDPTAAATSVVALVPGASPKLAAALLTILAERGCPSATLLPAAPGLLASPAADLRRATLAALATVPSLATTTILPLLEDPDPAVALAAVEWLRGRGATERRLARARLLTLVGSARGAIREAAAPLAAALAPEALAPLLGDPLAAIRRAAALAAGSLAAPPEAVILALLRATCDDVSAVRAAAVAALAHHRGATATLVAALEDPAPGVRAAGAMALLQAEGSHLRDLAQRLPVGRGWGRTTGLAVLTRRSPWRWRSALLAEEGVELAELTRLAVARRALGPPSGPAGALLRRDLDDALADGLVRWGECLTITDGPGAARIVRQGLVAEEPRVRFIAQEALEAMRSPALARLAAALLETHKRVARVGADERGGRGERTGRLTTADLAIGGGHWRRQLLAAAAREEPGLPGCDNVTATPYGEDRSMLSLVERASLLRGVPPFADLPSEHLRLLAEVAEEVDIAAGETLVAAGKEGDQLYLIVAGQVALEERRGAAGSVARIGTLGPGAAVGEDAVFDGGMHVLSATAVTDCRLLALGREVLLALLEEQPALARTLIAWLSARLRETSGKLAERTRPRPRSVVDLLDQIGDGRR